MLGRVDSPILVLLGRVDSRILVLLDEVRIKPGSGETFHPYCLWRKVEILTMGWLDRVVAPTLVLLGRVDYPILVLLGRIRIKLGTY